MMSQVRCKTKKKKQFANKPLLNITINSAPHAKLKSHINDRCPNGKKEVLRNQARSEQKPSLIYDRSTRIAPRLLPVSSVSSGAASNEISLSRRKLASVFVELWALSYSMTQTPAEGASDSSSDVLEVRIRVV